MEIATKQDFNLLLNEVKELKALTLQKANENPKPETPIGIKEVATLTKLTVPTLYGYCQRNEIPYSKKANRLFFFRADILNWIRSGNQKTLKEINVDADIYLNSKK